MTPVTTTWATSITNGVFAVYVMKLVEQNKLNLDKPIAELLPKPLDSYPDYKQTAGDLVRDPRWATVTPRMLLSHTSGLANFAFLEPDKKMHLHYAPGSRFAYSGEGLAFKPLLEGILGDTVTPWEWEGYTQEGVLASREHH